MKLWPPCIHWPTSVNMLFVLVIGGSSSTVICHVQIPISATRLLVSSHGGHWWNVKTHKWESAFNNQHLIHERLCIYDTHWNLSVSWWIHLFVNSFTFINSIFIHQCFIITCGSSANKTSYKPYIMSDIYMPYYTFISNRNNESSIYIQS